MPSLLTVHKTHGVQVQRDLGYIEADEMRRKLLRLDAVEQVQRDCNDAVVLARILSNGGRWPDDHETYVVVNATAFILRASQYSQPDIGGIFSLRYTCLARFENLHLFIPNYALHPSTGFSVVEVI